MTQLCPIIHPLLSEHPIKHGFFGRKGGVSKGVYESLNLGRGSSDQTENMDKNKEYVQAYFEDAPLLTLYQHHSEDIVVIDKENLEAHQKTRTKADGMVTNLHHIVLGILTADCAPVLFYEPQSGLIGAAHAGWKGASLGIAQKMVNIMQTMGAKLETIKAVIGPAIQQASYEVDENFKNHFMDRHGNQAQIFFADGVKANHHQFDLPGFIQNQLALSGLALHNIATINHDTYALPDEYYSYRRATHLYHQDYGRQISAIMLL